MQQAYNTSNPSYMNSNFYNASSYGSYGLGSGRTNPLNAPCKSTSSTSGYLAPPYGSPSSPFTPAAATPQSTIGNQYASPYSGYSCAAGTSTNFTQNFTPQVMVVIFCFAMIFHCFFPNQTVDYGGYGASYADAQSVAQYSSPGYYAVPSYSPYVSSPSSSGSIGTSSYQLAAATSLPGNELIQCRYGRFHVILGYLYITYIQQTSKHSNKLTDINKTSYHIEQCLENMTIST